MLFCLSDCSAIIGNIKLYKYSTTEVKLTWTNNRIDIGVRFLLYIDNPSYTRRSKYLDYLNSNEQMLRPGDSQLFIESKNKSKCDWYNRATGARSIYSDFISVEPYTRTGKGPLRLMTPQNRL